MSSDAARQDAESTHGPKRRLLRWAVRLVVLVLLLAVGVVVLGPRLLSTDAGTRLVVSLVNDRVDGELSIDAMQLRWGSGQRIDGLTYTDAAKGTAAQWDSLDAPEVALHRLLRGDRNLGTITLRGFSATATERAALSDQTELTTADDSSDDQPIALPPGLSVAVVIENLRLEYQAIDQLPAVVRLASGKIDLPDLRDISFDLDASLKQGERTGRIALRGGVVNLFDPEGMLQAYDAAYDIDSEVSGLSTVVLDRVLAGLTDAIKPGQLAALLGEGDATATAQVNGTIEQLLAELHVQSPNLSVDLYQVRQDKTLIASPKSSASLQLTPEAFAAVFPDSPLSLVERREITMRSLEVKLPTARRGFDFDAASLLVRISAQDDLLLRDPKGETLRIDALQLRGGATSLAQRLAFELSATLSAKGERGVASSEAIKAELIIDRPLQKDREMVFFTEALPIQLADALAGQDGRLVLWLGEMLALRVDVRGKIINDPRSGDRVAYTYRLLPEGRINGELTGSIDAGRLTAATPSNQPIEATLVPEAFANLMTLLSGDPDRPVLTIEKPMPVFVTLRDQERGAASLVADPSKRGAKRYFPDPDRTYVGATIELSPTRVYDPNQRRTYELRGGTLSLSLPDLRGKAEVSADLRLWVRPNAGGQGVESSMSWQATVADLLDTEGAVPLDFQTLMQQIAMDGGVSLKSAPSGLFDSLLNREGDIASILGPVVQAMDADFTYKDGRATGATLRLNWNEQTNQPIADAWASMSPTAFDIDDQQMLTVRGGRDIELEVKVSPEFGDRWMGKLHPLLFDAKSGDRPIRVSIDGKSFRFPMNDPTMKGARVQSTVDLGSIQFGNSALLGQMMGWAGRPGERAIFEPADVTLIDGKIRYDKFDLAVGNVQLRMDGEVDLATGEIVEMAVRVPGRSLARVFRDLDGVIAPNDYLSFPMTGSIRDPQVNTNLLLREVARLAARGLIRDRVDFGDDEAGRIGGKIFGRVLDDLGLGGPAPQPEPQPERPEQPAEPKQPVEDQLRDELINQGLDLIFGGRKPDPKPEANPDPEPKQDDD